jgi:hypothetical protein
MTVNPPRPPRPRGVRGYRGEILIFAVVVVAAVASELAEREAARALPLNGPLLSPTETFPDTVRLNAEYRMRQQKLCLERAEAVVSSGGQGTDTASVDHAGMAGDRSGASLGWRGRRGPLDELELRSHRARRQHRVAGSAGRWLTDNS